MDPKLLADINLQKNDLESFSYGKNAPPNYDKSESSKFTAPTSSTLFKSVKYARDTTRGGVKAIKKMGAFFCCSITITIILFILMAVPISMISIGSIYIKDCPIQKMIPIWLIVFGALSLVKNLSTLFQRIKHLRNKEDQGSSTLLNVFDSFLALVLIIWFICGNIWTYSNNNKVQFTDYTNSTTYCNKLTYYFAFWTITSIYIIIVLACLVFCCTICFTIFLPSKK